MRFVKIALALAALCPIASYAVLGGTPNTAAPAVKSLLAAQAATQASSPVSTVTTASYSVHQSTDADGITVREYALPSNVVFAVTWDGPVRPDMRALLGSYFPNYVSAGEERLRGTGALILSNGELQIESAGRPGHFLGMAYIPRLMPADLRANNLQ